MFRLALPLALLSMMICSGLSYATPHKKPLHHHPRHVKIIKHSKTVIKKKAIKKPTKPLRARALLIPPTSFIAPVQNDLVDFVRKTVNTLHYSRYKLGGAHFDTDRGVYIVDCSNFVDHILQEISPHAYSSLVNYSGSYSPATQHYYEFFAELTDNPDSYWNTVENLDDLKPGDILVFRKKNSRGRSTSGHIMVVMNKPIRDTNVYSVRVADSAPARHSQDTRKPFKGGIGIGTLLLKANPKTGKPAAYAWGVGGSWNKNAAFAMARPMDVD